MGLAGLSIAMLSASANAEIESEFYAGYDSSYIFRGINLGDDLYSFGFDFSGSCDCGFDWNAGIWYANFGDDFAFADEEIDIYAGISKDFGGVTASLGFIRYILPDAAIADFTELYGGLSTTVGAVDLAVTVYWTIDAEAGLTFGPSGESATGDFYYEFTADYSLPIAEKVSLDLNGTAGFVSNSGDDYSTFSATAGLNFALSEAISLSTYVSAEFTEGADFRDFISSPFGAPTEDGDDFFGGASVSFAF